MKENQKKIISLIIIILLLLLPIILYLYNFGYTLSSNHQKWSEFGSLMSGIYSPIFALFALLILIAQASAQSDMHKHQYDQSYIQQNREELNFYIKKLEQYLDESYSDNQTIGEYLQINFSKVADAELKTNNMIEIAKKFNREHPKVFNIWLAIYPLLIGLNTPKEQLYMSNFIGAKLQLITCFQYSICKAIDNLHFAVSNDPNKGTYYFKDME